MDIVKRKLMLVTIGTFLVWSLGSSSIYGGDGCENVTQKLNSHYLNFFALIPCRSICPGNVGPFISGFEFQKTVSTIMDKSLGARLYFWGFFQFILVQPLPSPHKQCWTRVSRIFFRVSALYRVGEGELQENFGKDALF